jgi:HK97 family phage portal protein
MNKRQRQKVKARAEPSKKRSQAWLCSSDAFDTLTCQGYTSLAHNPEIITGVGKIAKLIGSMTIHLMQNTEDGDIRVRNELSRKIDINPNENMTRSLFVQWIVTTMYLYGDGNAVVYPQFRRGYLQDLKPIPASMASFIPSGIWDYMVAINGKEYSPDEVLHFVLNPGNYYPWKGEGLQVALRDVANNLKQASTTEKGFMKSKWKPSIIVKVDALTEEFSSPEGRRQLLSDYIDTAEAGEPWMIPAEQFEIEQVKPLSLSDLALADMVQLDKKTVASILGVPPFVLGVGEFKQDEWNNFIDSTIMPVAQSMQQEFTKKLLYSQEYYFKFNPRSLYNYSLQETISAGAEMVDRMAMRRNEWRDWVGLPPDAEMNELLALENYLPANRLGDQGKLVQNGGE